MFNEGAAAVRCSGIRGLKQKELCAGSCGMKLVAVTELNHQSAVSQRHSRLSKCLQVVDATL
jgi:hypothetical protein